MTIIKIIIDEIINVSKKHFHPTSINLNKISFFIRSLLIFILDCEQKTLTAYKTHWFINKFKKANRNSFYDPYIQHFSTCLRTLFDLDWLSVYLSEHWLKQLYSDFHLSRIIYQDLQWIVLHFYWSVRILNQLLRL